jgi:hypothetical protein
MKIWITVDADRVFFSYMMGKVWFKVVFSLLADRKQKRSVRRGNNR